MMFYHIAKWDEYMVWCKGDPDFTQDSLLSSVMGVEFLKEDPDETYVWVIEWNRNLMQPTHHFGIVPEAFLMEAQLPEEQN